jgi:hypothetical protein
MAKVYYDLIKKGLWEIEKVPSVWRDEVQAMLDADA